MFNRIDSFSPVLIASVHKSAAPALVADAIATAAEAYALSGGGKIKYQTIAAACLTTDKGKTRTPAAGTAAALIHASMLAILTRAEGAQARPNNGTKEDRATRADDFGATIRAEYVASVDAAKVARSALHKVAPAAPAATPEGSAEKIVSDPNKKVVAGDLAPSVALASVAALSSQEFAEACKAAPAVADALRALLAGFDASQDKGVQGVMQGVAAALMADSVKAVKDTTKTARKHRAPAVAA